MSPTPGYFLQDDDCQWYFVDHNMVKEFYELLEQDDDYEEFNKLFLDKMCADPSNYKVVRLPED